MQGKSRLLRELTPEIRFGVAVLTVRATAAASCSPPLPTAAASAAVVIVDVANVPLPLYGISIPSVGAMLDVKTNGWTGRWFTPTIAGASLATS